MKAIGDLLSMRSSKVTSRSKFCIITVSLIDMDSFKGNISSFIYTFQILRPTVWLPLGSFMNKMRNWSCLSLNFPLSFSFLATYSPDFTPFDTTEDLFMRPHDSIVYLVIFSVLVIWVPSGSHLSIVQIHSLHTLI